jgi:hypothetical protein
MISGAPNSGKSTLGAWLATVLLTRDRFPDGTRIEPDANRQIMWLDSLDGYKRLLEHVRALKIPPGIYWPLNDPEEDFPVLDMTQDRCLELVANVAVEKRPVWVIVGETVPRRRDGSPDLEYAIEAMNKVAGDVRCGVTFLWHEEISGSKHSGAQGWANIADKMATIMALRRCDPATHDMVLKVIKTNFDDRPDASRLRFDSGIPQVVRRPLEPPRTRLDRAAAFLEEQLLRGARPARTLIDEAWSRYRVSPRTLRRGKRRLEVKTYKSGGRWWWVR